MKHFFVLDGVKSSDFGCYIATTNTFDAPERDVEVVEVAGLNGDLIFDNGRFKNFDATLNAYIPRDMQTNVGGLRNWLLTKSANYYRYEDTLHPDEFRFVRYAGGYSLDVFDRVGAAFPITFNCKPQRFLKFGEQMNAVSSGSVIYNPTQYAARPLIRVFGNGSITISGVTQTVTENTSYIDLDCEIQDAFRGSVNCNALVTPTFPVIESGVQTVTFTGFSQVLIKPRWWTI